MAVAIDTACIAQHYIPRLQKQLDHVAGGVRRFQVHRVCALATPVFLDSTFGRAVDMPLEYTGLPNESAMGWQADPDDDVHEVEVLHHLQQQAASIPVFSNQKDHTNDAITLVATAVSPSFSTMTHGRLSSSFHRHSLRFSGFIHAAYEFRPSERPRYETMIVEWGFFSVQGLHDDLDNFFWDISTDLEIVWDSSKRGHHHMFWQVQLDVVDLFRQRAHPCSRPGKRRRSAFSPFLQVSNSPVLEDTSRRNHLPHTKRFNGVRHRPDRSRWVAEMKPPKYKNKQDFGNFKSQAQAARAVDAAFHHYGKPHLLNFPDSSPTILSTRPSAAAGLDETAKLRFVKEEAKWLATMATNSPLPSARPNSNRFQSPERSTSCTALPPGRFRSFSGISSPLRCASPEEADDAVSQPQPWMHLHPFPEIAVQSLEPNSGGSSVEITELAWNGAEDWENLAGPPNVESPRACEMQSMWLDSLIRSPPAPMCSMSPSPSECEVDLVHALLEQQCF